MAAAAAMSSRVPAGEAAAAPGWPAGRPPPLLANWVCVRRGEEVEEGAEDEAVARAGEWRRALPGSGEGAVRRRE